MREGLAPKVRARIRRHKTGLEEEILVEKELHHIQGREIASPHSQSNIVELWPWEHADIDDSRYTGYDFLGYK